MDPRHYGFSQFADSPSSFGGSIINDGFSNAQPLVSTNETPASEQAQPVSTSMKRSIRSASFSVQEDLLLIHAWINISTDPVAGTDQRRDQFWKRIYEFYHECKKFATDRTQKSLTQRWSNIQLAVSKFQGCYGAIEERRQSGLNEQDKIQQAKELYCSLQKVSSFNFEHCWNLLRNQPKWLEESSEKMSKKQKSHSSASPASSSPSSSTPNHINLDDEDDGFVDLVRPPGRKAEKARRGKSKSFLQDGNLQVPIIGIFEKMQEKKLDVYRQAIERDADRVAVEKDRIATDNARVAADNARVAADNAKTALERAKFDAEQASIRAAEEERIMSIDCEKLPHNQAVYYAARQREILARTVGSSGYSSMQ